MNLLSVDNLSKSYSDKWLFNDIHFGLSKGDKMALVGANGAGKTTLLKIIAGIEKQDNGYVAFSNHASVAYLAQDPELDLEKTIEQTIYGEDNPVLSIIKQYESAILLDDFPADKMQFLLEKMEEFEAWEFDKLVAQVLSKLGITNIKQLNQSLSGGQRKRVALAKMILFKPDLLLLDEPTNHLDLEAIEWLEVLLKSHSITLLMITHDRYFLDNVATQIIELDGGKLFHHNGNYAKFLENKSARKANEKIEMSKARLLMLKELEWMRKMPKARGTKSKSRIEAFYDLKDKVSQSSTESKVEINVEATRLGNKVVEMHNVSFSYNELPIVNNFTYLFNKKDRIGIIGKNGVGKSTFLNLLTQKINPQKGTIVHGPTLNMGYFTQQNELLNYSNRIIDEVKAIAEYVVLGNGDEVSVAKLLEMFLFPPSMQHTPISKLSGGEKKRLQLLKVLVSNPNFLILDEPTNDLDIDTLNVLEDFLTDYKGCLVLVSHDRYFMDNLVEHLFVFEENGEIKDFYGNYSDLRMEQSEKQKEKQVVAPINKTIETKVAEVKKQKKSFKEQQEFNQLEKELTELETFKIELEKKLEKGSENHSEIIEWADKLESVNKEIEVKTMRWLELSELD